MEAPGTGPQTPGLIVPKNDRTSFASVLDPRCTFLRTALAF